MRSEADGGDRRIPLDIPVPVSGMWMGDRPSSSRTSPQNIVDAFVSTFFPNPAEDSDRSPLGLRQPRRLSSLCFAQRDGTIKAVPIDRLVSQSSSPRAASFSSSDRVKSSVNPSRDFRNRPKSPNTRRNPGCPLEHPWHPYLDDESKWSSGVYWLSRPSLRFSNTSLGKNSLSVPSLHTFHTGAQCDL